MGINREENCDIYITNMLSSWTIAAMKAVRMQEILYVVVNTPVLETLKPARFQMNIPT